MRAWRSSLTPYRGGRGHHGPGAPDVRWSRRRSSPWRRRSNPALVGIIEVGLATGTTSEVVVVDAQTSERDLNGYYARATRTLLAVLRACEHGRCVRAARLMIGTARANSVHMAARGRSAVGRGPGGGVDFRSARPRRSKSGTRTRQRWRPGPGTERSARPHRRRTWSCSERVAVARLLGAAKICCR